MSRAHFFRRRPFSSVLLLLLVFLMGWIWQERVALWAFADIISAYTAKEYCSCRYVMNNDADYCRGYVKQWLPVSGFVDDIASRRVVVSGLGRSNSAQWVGERQGCQLQP
ncbi:MULTISPECIES: amidase [unclassified Pseudomonas]|uniref:amidase n=1 Tax=unclassified Pseudomonas TaxID=196821 RepID=UPI002AC89EEE|nr:MULTISPECIES: amidase [unclassified Pseudomonas]MEB0045866.1 amidase [Pseudomonas sp. Dout3]MEB0096646.1 amidase [Pseudomonas sp. DC1.2]WPX60233.1 amidase [Pseudomonas sp. DC1.2]